MSARLELISIEEHCFATFPLKAVLFEGFPIGVYFFYSKKVNTVFVAKER